MHVVKSALLTQQLQDIQGQTILNVSGDVRVIGVHDNNGAPVLIYETNPNDTANQVTIFHVRVNGTLGNIEDTRDTYTYRVGTVRYSDGTLAAIYTLAV